MLEPLLLGFILGVSLSFMVGPVMFMLLQVCICHGFKSGMTLSFGVLLSDITILLMCYFGLFQIIGTDPRQNMFITTIGGVVLIIFGAYSFFKGGKTEKIKKRTTKEACELEYVKKPKSYMFIAKGYLMNIANPGIWFLWIVTMLKVVSTYQDNNSEILLFFIGTCLTIVCFDALKCMFSCYLKKKLNDKSIDIMNKIVGIIIAGFGIFMIINTFVDLSRMINIPVLY